MLPVKLTHRVFGSPLSAWDPFRVFDRLGRWPDLGTGNGPGAIVGGFDVDVREDEDRYTIEANLPGVDKDGVEVTFEDGVLTIEGEVRRDDERQGANFHLRERCVGKLSRSFRLPAEADSEKVKATLADGVLTVTVEKDDQVITAVDGHPVTELLVAAVTLIYRIAENGDAIFQSLLANPLHQYLATTVLRRIIDAQHVHRRVREDFLRDSLEYRDEMSLRLIGDNENQNLA